MASQRAMVRNRRLTKEKASESEGVCPLLIIHIKAVQGHLTIIYRLILMSLKSSFPSPSSVRLNFWCQSHLRVEAEDWVAPGRDVLCYVMLVSKGSGH